MMAIDLDPSHPGVRVGGQCEASSDGQLQDLVLTWNDFTSKNRTIRRIFRMAFFKNDTEGSYGVAWISGLADVK